LIMLCPGLDTRGITLSLCSLSQPVLTQPSSLSASPGTTARLTCTLSRHINVGNYNIYWYQQMPGSSPRYLLYYYSSTQLGSGVPNRFSGSKDASANAGLRLISGLQPEDEADYYCLKGHNSSSQSDRGRWMATCHKTRVCAVAYLLK
uniref:Ig-like domain-containing protein n=1 Tax=Suricata suricatta TaxID=37032 RepID=A0A673U9U1_SURSU